VKSKTMTNLDVCGLEWLRFQVNYI
jgi:hypothetical protein